MKSFILSLTIFFTISGVASATAPASTARASDVCKSKIPGFVYDNCAQVGNKMVVTNLGFTIGSDVYGVAWASDGDREHETGPGNRLCAVFGAKTIVNTTWVVPGGGGGWTQIALISEKDCSFMDLDQRDQKIDTVTCTL